MRGLPVKVGLTQGRGRRKGNAPYSHPTAPKRYNRKATEDPTQGTGSDKSYRAHEVVLEFHDPLRTGAGTPLNSSCHARALFQPPEPKPTPTSLAHDPQRKVALTT